MDEKAIYKISLAVMLAGIIVLLIFAGQVDLKGVAQLDELENAESVKLSGTISKLSAQDKVIFIELSGQKDVKTAVIVFEDQDVFLQEGDSVEVTGYVEEYNGEKEIVANKIVKK